jgi:hypothetical protein
MKNFKKVLSKTVVPLYFADTYAHRHTQTFKKGLSNEGYAKHTPTPRKPGYRFTWIPHKARCRFFETFSKDNTYAFGIRGHVLPRRDSGRYKGA